MSRRCICPADGLADEDCPVCGLPPGVGYAPMDRHARRTYDRFGNPTQVEDARSTQRRLYEEAMKKVGRRKGKT